MDGRLRTLRGCKPPFMTRINGTIEKFDNPVDVIKAIDANGGSECQIQIMFEPFDAGTFVQVGRHSEPMEVKDEN